MTLNMGFSFPSLISICTSKFSLKVKLFHLSLGTLSSLLPYTPLHLTATVWGQLQDPGTCRIGLGILYI